MTKPCPTCDGQGGWKDDYLAEGFQAIECPDCQGSGKQPEQLTQSDRDQLLLKQSQLIDRLAGKIENNHRVIRSLYQAVSRLAHICHVECSSRSAASVESVGQAIQRAERRLERDIGRCGDCVFLGEDECPHGWHPASMSCEKFQRNIE